MKLCVKCETRDLKPDNREKDISELPRTQTHANTPAFWALPRGIGHGTVSMMRDYPVTLGEDSLSAFHVLLRGPAESSFATPKKVPTFCASFHTPALANPSHRLFRPL
jgi:hypothetical protein